MSFLLDLFTGSSKWLYIALIALGLGFAGATALSISLHADKAALNATIDARNGTIKDLNGTVNDQKKEIAGLNDTLVKKRTEIDTQNARIKDLEADIKAGEEKAQKEIATISAKHEALRQSLNFKVDDNASADDVKRFVNGFEWMRQ